MKLIVKSIYYTLFDANVHCLRANNRMNIFFAKHMAVLLHGRTLSVFFLGGLLWLPLTLSWAEDQPYRLNPGDKLEITVWGEKNLDSKVVVLPDGTISFPLAGPVPAATKTIAELVDLLKERLGKLIPAPEINVQLIAADGNIIYVIGEVTHPGPIVMRSPMDVMQALSTAGGFTPFAKKNSIHILRRDSDDHSQTIAFEYSDVADGENMKSNILLKSGDTIVVP